MSRSGPKNSVDFDGSERNSSVATTWTSTSTGWSHSTMMTPHQRREGGSSSTTMSSMPSQFGSQYAPNSSSTLQSTSTFLSSTQFSSPNAAGNSRGHPAAATNVTLVGKVGGDRYTIVEVFSEGASGDVILAFDEHERKQVVLKRAKDTEDHQSFLEEFNIHSSLDHPNIVKVLEDHLVDDQWMVMEYANGGSLAPYCEPLKNDIPTVVDIMKETLDALQYLHSRGIIHRDVKPANIVCFEEPHILTDGREVYRIRYKLTDFGVSRQKNAVHINKGIANGTTASTSPFSTTYGGTPMFSPPENPIEGQSSFSTATDVWAWACTIAYIATGVQPYQGDNKETPTQDELRDVGLSMAFQNALLQCFSPNPRDRPTTDELSNLVLRGTGRDTHFLDEVSLNSLKDSASPNLKTSGDANFVDRQAALANARDQKVSCNEWQNSGGLIVSSFHNFKIKGVGSVSPKTDVTEYFKRQQHRHLTWTDLPELLERMARSYSTHDHEQLRHLAKKGTGITNKTTSSGETIFHLAAKHQLLDVLQILLKAGARPNVSDNYGNTPLHTAVYFGHADVVEALIRSNSKIDRRNIWDYTPLLLASVFGDNNLVRQLIDSGANCNHQEMYKFTPLHFAAQRDDENIATTLLQNGALTSSTNCSGLTPFQLALKVRSVRVVSLFMENGAHMPSKNQLLREALLGSHCDIAELLLEQGADPNFTVDGTSVLHISLKRGLLGVARGLVCRGADVNYALHFAAEVGALNIAETLLQSMTHPYAANSRLQTPLHRAAYFGHVSFVKLLANYGFDVNFANFKGETPLCVALAKSNIDVGEYLLDVGADVNLVDHRGRSPLYHSLVNGLQEFTVKLAKRGANVEAPILVGEEGTATTLLHFAIQKRQTVVAKFLIESGVDVNDIGTTQEHPLFLCIANDTLSLVMPLLQHGCDINVLRYLRTSSNPFSYDSNSLVAHLLIQGSKEQDDCAELLVKCGANVEFECADLPTPLSVAINRGLVEIIKMLLEHGANPNERNASGDSLLTQSARHSDDEIAHTLLDYGAECNVVSSGRSVFSSIPNNELHRRLHQQVELSCKSIFL